MIEPRVFVTEAPHPNRLPGDGRGGHLSAVDFGPAKRYGKLVMVMTNHEVHRLSIKALYGLMRMALKTFGPNDYLLMRGNPTIMTLCALVAAHKSPEQVQMLYWDRHQRNYVVVKMRFAEGKFTDTLDRVPYPSGTRVNILEFTDTGILPCLPDGEPA